jgi:hypothetical protein
MIGDLRFVERDVLEQSDGREADVRRFVKRRILQMRYINKEGYYSEWQDVPMVGDEHDQQ